MSTITLKSNFKDLPSLIKKITDGVQSRLDTIASQYRSEFVRNALSEPGPHSLGVQTGRLQGAFTVEGQKQGEIGFLRVFVPPSEPQIYGMEQEARIGWFSQGLLNSQATLLSSVDKAIKDAIAE